MTFTSATDPSSHFITSSDNHPKADLYTMAAMTVCIHCPSADCMLTPLRYCVVIITTLIPVGIFADSVHYLMNVLLHLTHLYKHAFITSLLLYIITSELSLSILHLSSSFIFYTSIVITGPLSMLSLSTLHSSYAHLAIMAFLISLSHLQ